MNGRAVAGKPQAIWQIYLYHAIEKSANQNTGKQLSTRLYYNQPSIVRRVF